jgi:hypothetical protein
VLRKIFKLNDGREEWRTLHSRELGDLYRAPDSVIVTKSVVMDGWAYVIQIWVTNTQNLGNSPNLMTSKTKKEVEDNIKNLEG